MYCSVVLYDFRLNVVRMFFMAAHKKENTMKSHGPPLDLDDPDSWHTMSLKLLDIDSEDMKVNVQHKEFLSSCDGCNWEVCCDT